MAKEKPAFLIYKDSKPLIDILTDSQAGALFKAILSYETGEEVEELEPLVNMAFMSIKTYLDRDKEKYKETCIKRAENGRKGGLAKASKSYQVLAKASNTKQHLANLADRDIDKDIEIDRDIDTDKEKKKKPVKHKYGEYNNVLLTDEELEAIKAEFPTDWEERINVLSAYVASSGKKYKNILATLRNWAKNEDKRKKGAYDDVPEQRSKYTTEEFF